MNAKNLLYRCKNCKQLKRREHFHKSGASLASRRHEMSCTACLQRCEGCGERKEQDDLVVDGRQATMCAKCLVRRQVAESNVYYRYPVLHYRSAPFSTEKFRAELAETVNGDSVLSAIRRRRPR